MSKILIDRAVVEQALEALETVLSDAYHRRFPECCGRPGSECCGNPNEAWAPEDNKIMDALSPVQRQLSDALRAALAEQPAGPDAEPAIPPGYKLVPVEPTPAMLVAINWPNDPAGYRAMLAAAPEAPQPVKREPLTDEEICAALDIDGADDWTFKVAYAAIAAYERKNGGQP